ncbi:MAG: UDP-4-amino-4,6-dideoxy-N-acetyl-beta-L-altrosamine transaminase [Deltaproteobacteria bacterium HGW-Deltaproteobacteria-19]|jgi:perosamine synthetase|nr:MAG: UDP-4-amino-4,6-dideoxy-N-acetyl-beta-L-altrosamine transaminase [Deltaproteobacteria bacterium HGW-Deltaproteobacteria-19]
MIPYGRQSIDEADIQAVVEVLRSGWLTTGPGVEEFEKVFARFVEARHAVAVSSGTAALHAAVYALGIGPGDEVIVPTMTFAATANCVVFQGGTPIFADVDPETLLIDPDRIEDLITPRTRAIIAVDYAGQPCDYEALEGIARRRGLHLVDDACHALGAAYRGRSVGSLAGLNCFSFHPVKHITTGEGGMITTDDPELARRMRIFRNHGITTDHRERQIHGAWFYEMTDLGYNYRLTDFQCALGLRQLEKLSGWNTRRREVAKKYDAAFRDLPSVAPLAVTPEVLHAYHLYVIRLQGVDRDGVFQALRATGIGVNVHYIPVHLHPFYRRRFGTGPGLCPVAEEAFGRILSLPMYPGMTDEDVETVIAAVDRAVHG